MVRRYKGSVWARLMTPFLSVLMFMGIFALVWLSAEVRSTEYALGGLEGRIEEEFMEKQEIEARLSSLMSIREVDQRGLELGFPDRKKVFFVLREDVSPGQTASLKEGSIRGLVEP